MAEGARGTPGRRSSCPADANCRRPGVHGADDAMGDAAGQVYLDHSLGRALAGVQPMTPFERNWPPANGLGTDGTEPAGTLQRTLGVTELDRTASCCGMAGRSSA